MNKKMIIMESEGLVDSLIIRAFTQSGEPLFN